MAVGVRGQLEEIGALGDRVARADLAGLEGSRELGEDVAGVEDIPGQRQLVLGPSEVQVQVLRHRRVLRRQVEGVRVPLHDAAGRQDREDAVGQLLVEEGLLDQDELVAATAGEVEAGVVTRPEADARDVRHDLAAAAGRVAQVAVEVVDGLA